MVVLAGYVVLFELELNSKSQDAILPDEKNENLSNVAETQAANIGIPVIYSSMYNSDIEQMIANFSDSSVTPLIVTLETIKDDMDRYTIGVIKKYQYGTNINIFQYFAPEYYYIESFNSDFVTLKKDRNRLNAGKAWGLYELLIGEIILVLLFVAAKK